MGDGPWEVAGRAAVVVCVHVGVGVGACGVLVGLKECWGWDDCVWMWGGGNLLCCAKSLQHLPQQQQVVVQQQQQFNNMLHSTPCRSGVLFLVFSCRIMKQIAEMKPAS